MKPKAGRFSIAHTLPLLVSIAMQMDEVMVFNALQMHEIEVPCQPVFFLVTKTLKREMLRRGGGGKGEC